jgi:hypothetical protein
LCLRVFVSEGIHIFQSQKEFEKKLQTYTENISCAFTFMCDYSGKIPLNFGL